MFENNLALPPNERRTYNCVTDAAPRRAWSGERNKQPRRTHWTHARRRIVACLVRQTATLYCKWIIDVIIFVVVFRTSDIRRRQDVGATSAAVTLFTGVRKTCFNSFANAPHHSTYNNSPHTSNPHSLTRPDDESDCQAIPRRRRKSEMVSNSIIVAYLTDRLPRPHCVVSRQYM